MIIVPNVVFRVREEDNTVLGNGCSIGGKWKDISTDDIFKNKKVLIFSLPGAFTPTCSSLQLPEYEKMYDKLIKYVDDIYCVSVNDSFVMNAWLRDLQIKKIKPIADGEGKFTKNMGMLVNKPAQGFGMRSWRYSALVYNCEVIKMFIEKGKNDHSKDDDPFKISNAETAYKFLKNINFQT